MLTRFTAFTLGFWLTNLALKRLEVTRQFNVKGR